jgi:hypothetical protein
MSYWWVNQNQTYKAEVKGGFLWSPKVNKDGIGIVRFKPNGIRKMVHR